MRIAIDLQGAQTSSRFRGIGRYSLSLAKNLCKCSPQDEIIIALSGLMPDTIGPIRSEFSGILPDDNIRVWSGPGPVRQCDAGNKWRRQTAELVRESFLAGLNPDIILITSLFEGFVDDAVTSIGRFDPATKVAVLNYDLIPLSSPDHYLSDTRYRDYYYTKLGWLKNASLILTISDYTALDTENILKTDFKRQIISISSAADSHFCSSLINDSSTELIKSLYKITRRAVLYAPGGCDHRKNFNNLIQAYAGLPGDVRSRHQLVIISRLSEINAAGIRETSRQAGLKKDEVILTGYVPEKDLAAMYKASTLFVFPTRREGFGLPVLEAMSCGVPVIGSDASSIPEVINNPEALFNPESITSIRNKILQALTDHEFRQNLTNHSLSQSKQFSWTKTAKKALEAMRCTAWHSPAKAGIKRKKMACLSPIPPQQTGIAMYSAELLPHLAKYYDIDVFVLGNDSSIQSLDDKYSILNAEDFEKHYTSYERVIYHLGNSSYHKHMFRLIEKFPGIVVLHDFFLGHINQYIEGTEGDNFWIRQLYLSHGYKAFSQRIHSKNSDIESLAWEYPCNKSVIDHSLGVVVHSKYAKGLALQWLGQNCLEKFSVIPFLKNEKAPQDRLEAKKMLGYPEGSFVVCCFGVTGLSKLNHRIINAWSNSELGKNLNCFLIFVGKNDTGQYGADLDQLIKERGSANNISITGWVSDETYKLYLSAADAAVQLRYKSRGESSATVLDCMSYSMPVIINSEGAMAEIPSDAAVVLPDGFSDEDLGNSLEQLLHEPEMRRKTGENAWNTIKKYHAPSICAERYYQAIEKFYHSHEHGMKKLVECIAASASFQVDDYELKNLSVCLVKNKARFGDRYLYVDVSELVHLDLRTGIQRVVKSILLELLFDPPPGLRVEPVYGDPGQGRGYCLARRFTASFMECPAGFFDDEPIDPGDGDIFLGLDLQPHIVKKNAQYLQLIRALGVKVYFAVYDLLPVSHPGFFPPGSDQIHNCWLQNISKFDGAVCISESVANELQAWRKLQDGSETENFRIGWFHLGADIENSSPTKGLTKKNTSLLNKLAGSMTFLMVGTIEPRKGYLQTIQAFEILWNEGMDIRLVIVGQEGWKSLEDKHRRTIPEIISMLTCHDELEKRLFWLPDISDEFLIHLYPACNCLIAASEGEGFGLPLIEAAQHKLPVIARDIPVFREVAGEHAYFFQGNKPGELAVAVKDWLELYRNGKHPRSDNMPWLTWKQSADLLKETLFKTSAVCNSSS